MLPVDATIRFGSNGAVPSRAAAEVLDETPRTAAEIRACTRITGLVRQLPADGSVVIVHSPSVVDAWRHCIREIGGDLLAGATKVIAAPTLAAERAATAGLSALPVFRDPFVDAQREHRRALGQAWRL